MSEPETPTGWQPTGAPPPPSGWGAPSGSCAAANPPPPPGYVPPAPGYGPVPGYGPTDVGSVPPYGGYAPPGYGNVMVPPTPQPKKRRGWLIALAVVGVMLILGVGGCAAAIAFGLLSQ